VSDGLTPHELGELASKYALIRDLRQRRERGEPPPSREVFRDLARAFPGALRELDRMPMSVILRRIAELDRARTDGCVLLWMVVQAHYHRLLRYALAHKQRARLMNSPSILGVDEEFSSCLERPPGGRVVPLVLSAIARLIGRDVAEVASILES
jgi:hypothetical protein